MCGHEEFENTVAEIQHDTFMMESVLYGLRCSSRASLGGTTRAAARPGRLPRRQGPSALDLVHTCPHFRARVRRRHMLRGTARAQPQVPQILTVREPMGLSSRQILLLLASHSILLTRERKNLSQIAQEIKFISNFASCSVPKLVPNNLLITMIN